MFLRYAFIVLASILAANALAAPATSCPPLGALPGYLDAEPSDDLRAFNTFDFMTPSENDTSAVTGVSGRYCAQSLNIAEGVQPMSDLEIQSNYRSLLDALGATYFVKEENRTVAKVVKDGKETWIDAYSGEHWIETRVVQRTPHVFSLTTPGASDHAAFGHMPGYTVDNPERRNFAQHEFYLRDGEDTASVNIQGKFHFGSYYIAEGAPLASDADILENHRSVIKKLGGEILLAESNRTTGRYPGADGAPVWVEVSSGEHWYELRVVEEKPF
ncbi:MAG TPA: hypothetical protein VFN29_06470 [Chiayiivirga sp.]|nr:hypothetical protein [Chiayiivirga sp.]